jgi:hypothetical protein
MADLVALQPRGGIALFIVAPDERRQAVRRLEQEIEALGDRTRHLQASFLDVPTEQASRR